MLHLPSMSHKISNLGRETPFHLSSVAGSDHILVCYGDGLVLYRNGEPLRERRFSCQAAASLLSGDYIVGASDGRLELFGRDLVCLAEHPIESGEEIVFLLALFGDRFLALSESQEVSCWAYTDAKLRCIANWVSECQPLFTKGSGGSVFCEERGRLQERDGKTGAILRTWPKEASGVWGTCDPLGQHGLLIDEEGNALVLDLSGAEVLFHLECDFSACRACFSESGLSGALLGTGGDVALFQLSEGGNCKYLPSSEIPLIELCYHRHELLGLDENGEIWSLGEKPSRVGGDWAGWGTSVLWIEDGTVLVGTAHGTVETFNLRGERTQASVKVHHDAVIALEHWDGAVLSVGADASVSRLEPSPDGYRLKTIATYPGRSVVGCVLSPSGKRLWLALDEGLVAWLSLDNPNSRDELELEGRRIEEIRAADENGVLLVTDRGSIRYLRG